MKLFFRGFIVSILFFLLLSFSGKVYALQTTEIFATGIDSGGWDVKPNLYGAPDSIYASATNSYLSGYVRFTESLNIPVSATITSLVFKIYAAPSGNTGGSNYWNVYLNGIQCSYRPNLSLGNGLRTVAIDATNCTGTNNFADVVQANKGVLNMPSPHVIGYPQTNGTHTMVWDAIGVYATYELPDPVLAPTPSNIELAPGSVWEWTTATVSATQKEGLTDIISVSVGSDHSLALRKDGTVWAWGSNEYGQLGIGISGGSITNPVRVKSPDGLEYLTGVKAIATGANWYSMALKTDGTVWTWGYNGYGVRGTGIGTSTITGGSSKLLTPTQVKPSGGFLSTIAIAAGGNHSLALKSDGTVWAWGQNNNGQIGNGCFLYNCSMIRSPTQIIGDVMSIAAGDYHSLAVKTDGNVWGWGRLSHGQLGAVRNGWWIEQPSPVQIPEISGVKSVWARNFSSIALSENGTVFEWGNGRWFPEDGNPRQIPDLQDVSMISGGRSFIDKATLGVAIKTDGTVWMWDMYYLFARPIPGLSNIGSVAVGRFVPNLASVKMSESTPTPPPPADKTPLMFIPGMAGSELKTAEEINWSESDGHSEDGIFTHVYSEGEEIWVNILEAIKPGHDDYFDILRMSEDGQNSLANLELTGTLFDGYQETIDFFTSNGYTLNQDFFIFPYDWRRDISVTLPLLDQKIESIKQQTGSEKVDIVAHSMGGLVARNYISDANRSSNVGKLFTLGTPHLGSVKFLKAIKYGDCLKFEIGSACLSIASSELKDVIQNMISGYELAPSQEYFNFYTNQDRERLYPYSYNGQSLNYSQIKSFLTNLNYNTDLFDPGELFHTLDNSLTNTNDVDVTNIVGSGLPTLGQIIEKSAKNFSGSIIQKKDGFLINGDETVPLFSASLIDYGNNKSLLGNAKVFYAKKEHGELAAFGPALDLVKNILEGDDSLPDGISVSPYLFKGNQVSVHSPVNIHAYDFLGNHTGPTPDGDFEANIPGSSYDTIDDAKFIFLPDDGNYNIKFEAENQGSFDFKIRKYENNENTQTILYKDIPLKENTKAETVFNTLGEAPILLVDSNGDNIIDFNVNPSSVLTGDDVSDHTSPQTAIELSGREGLNDWYTSDVLVTLNPQDEENGSGILKTEYSLDGGKTINVYSEPFVISKEKVFKLKFRSIDNAGNEEEPKEAEVKIDKTPPEAKIFVDQAKRDLSVVGIDVNKTTVVSFDNTRTKAEYDKFYEITDLAGNTILLDVEDRDKEKQNRFRILSMRYNSNEEIVKPRNYFTVEYEKKGGEYYTKKQVFEISNESKVRIQYDSRKNKSTITLKGSKGEKIVEDAEGLVLLELLTNKGQLETDYH